MDKEREIETTECKPSLKAIAELNSAVVKEAKKQAVREFAEQVKERIHGYENISWDTDNCLCEDIDKLLAEVTGE